MPAIQLVGPLLPAHNEDAVHVHSLPRFAATHLQSTLLSFMGRDVFVIS